MKTSITQLLVHIDPSVHAARRLAFARRLAQRHGAALTALYAATPRFVELPFAPGVVPGIVANLRQLDETYLTQARVAFDLSQASAAGSSEVRAAWAQVDDEPMMAAFAEQSLYADLLVLGQHDPSASQALHAPADFVESIMVMSGKPALVIPFIGVPANLAETVVIAWKPTREAARAVAASLPLLQAAQRVHVVSWKMDEIAIGGARMDLGRYLEQRGIKAEWHPQGAVTADIGEMLLSRAFDLQADLLVMGCYGHSRAREWVLGGVSRTMLQSMTLPVLMAH